MSPSDSWQPRLYRYLAEAFAIGRRQQTGDPALQLATLLIVFVTISYLMTDVFLVFYGHITRVSAIFFLCSAALIAGLCGLAFGQKYLWRNIIAAALIYSLATALSAWFVDISYDGQSYHYQAIAELVRGWDPYHEKCLAFLPPGNVDEGWSDTFPKAAWIFSALQVAAGLSYEAAKNETLILVAATSAAVFGTARRGGWSVVKACLSSIAVILNPIILHDVFVRMPDGIMACYFTLFLALAFLGALGKDWRATALAMLVMMGALNSKQSGMVILPIFCLLLCVQIRLLRGWRFAANYGALYAVTGIVCLLIIGADPYLHNLVFHGNPAYPLRGYPVMNIDDDFRPRVFKPYPDAIRMLISLASQTTGGDPITKLPFTVYTQELLPSGDPETTVAAFGPLFSGAMILSLAMLASIAWKRLPWRSAPVQFAIAAILVFMSADLMPENWQLRYVPQLWLVPLLLMAGVMTIRHLRWLAVACGLTLAVDSLICGVSMISVYAPAAAAIHAQADEFAASGIHYRVDVGASGARLALFYDAGVSLSEVPGLSCVTPEPIPMAYIYNEDGSVSSGIACHNK